MVVYVTKINFDHLKSIWGPIFAKTSFSSYDKFKHIKYIIKIF